MANSVPGEIFLPGLLMALSLLCLHEAFFGACIWKGKRQSDLSSYTTTSPISSFHLYLLNALFPNTIPLRVRGSIYEFWRLCSSLTLLARLFCKDLVEVGSLKWPGPCRGTPEIDWYEASTEHTFKNSIGVFKITIKISQTSQSVSILITSFWLLKMIVLTGLHDSTAVIQLWVLLWRDCPGLSGPM